MVTNDITPLIQEIDADIKAFKKYTLEDDKEVIEACKNILHITKKLIKSEFIYDVEIDIRIRQAEQYYSYIYSYPIKYIRTQATDYLDDLFHKYIDMALQYECYEVVYNLEKFIEI